MSQEDIEELNEEKEQRLQDLDNEQLKSSIKAQYRELKSGIAMIQDAVELGEKISNSNIVNLLENPLEILIDTSNKIDLTDNFQNLKRQYECIKQCWESIKDKNESLKTRLDGVLELFEDLLNQIQLQIEVKEKKIKEQEEERNRLLSEEREQKRMDLSRELYNLVYENNDIDFDEYISAGVDLNEMIRFNDTNYNVNIFYNLFANIKSHNIKFYEDLLSYNVDITQFGLIWDSGEKYAPVVRVVWCYLEGEIGSDFTFKLLDLLIREGLDVNSPCAYIKFFDDNELRDVTPIFYVLSVAYKNFERAGKILSYFLNNGANANVVIKEGLHPLDIAINWDYPYYDIIKTLKGHSFDVERWQGEVFNYIWKKIRSKKKYTRIRNIIWTFIDCGYDITSIYKNADSGSYFDLGRNSNGNQMRGTSINLLGALAHGVANTSFERNFKQDFSNYLEYGIGKVYLYRETTGLLDAFFHGSNHCSEEFDASCSSFLDYYV